MKTTTKGSELSIVAPDLPQTPHPPTHPPNTQGCWANQDLPLHHECTKKNKKKKQHFSLLAALVSGLQVTSS